MSKAKSSSYSELDWKCINTIRCLAVDMPAKANSGHPGAPMGMAPISHVLFNKFMKFNPKNPHWLNRDRFVLSNGHACCLQYILLHLFGYDLPMDQLKRFRQLGSHTPGHPEANHGTPGIEVTTGPLGQGFANAVGLAIAQAHTAGVFNKPGFEIIDNYTYCYFGDGCAQEGVGCEAASLAGHLQLGNLIMVYDDNHISIDGDTNCSFTEDVLKRFEAYGWHTLHVKDGDHDVDAMEAAIEAAKAVKDKPSVIKLTTTIGFGSKLQGTGGVHGNPLKSDDAKNVKKQFGFDPESSFEVPQEVYDFYHKTAAKGAEAEKEWDELFKKYSQQFNKEAKELTRLLNKELPEGWQKCLPVYSPKDDAVASRKLSEIALTKLVEAIPELVGGSADLTGSNLTRWKGAVDFQPPVTKLGDWSGRYIRYGVREHAMEGIMNGLASYGTIIPFGGTFFNFVSYASGAVRLAALSKFRTLTIATHDSIGLGEDGPTHQPIETIAHFRATPNLMVWRPADGNETSAAYYVAISSKETPSILCLSRQNLPQLEGSSIEHAVKGGYVLVDIDEPQVTLASSGSEVSICVDAASVLKEQGIKARIVSLPCWETFMEQDLEYRLSVLKDGHPILYVEPFSTFGTEKMAHESFGINGWGTSAPYKDAYKKFEITPEGIAKRAKTTVDFWKDVKPIRSPMRRAFEQLI